MSKRSLNRRRKAVQFVREGLDMVEAEKRDARLRELSVKKVEENTKKGT